MKKKPFNIALVLALAASVFVAVSMPAAAQLEQTFKCPDGSVKTGPVGVPLQQLIDIYCPKLPAPEPGGGRADGPAPDPAPAPPAGDPGTGGSGGGGNGGTGAPTGEKDGAQGRGGDDRKAKKPKDDDTNALPPGEGRNNKGKCKKRDARKKCQKDTGGSIRKPDGSPTRQNPTFFDALPGPAQTTEIPNFVIRKFRVPLFLLPIYQAAGIQYGIPWQILAAVNEIETDYGRNLNVSTAGAVGWMQFLPSTFKVFGVDGNKDGRRDPYNPVDAIFSAANYLNASGGEKDLRKAIFAYNHADWYVDSVLMRARLISGVPDDLVGSLTGLTEGRFPVYARARYADDLAERGAGKKVSTGQNVANVVESKDDRKGIRIFTRHRAPVIAVNDGVVRKIGRSKQLGRYLVLQDVYGNQYTYSGLDSTAKLYPVPKDEVEPAADTADALPAKAPRPTGPASAGRQRDDAKGGPRTESEDGGPRVTRKQRLFANPGRKGARDAGGLEQLLASGRPVKGFTTFNKYFSRAFGLDQKDVRFARLKRGSRVIGGTVLGRVGRPAKDQAAHLYFEIRPAGRGAPNIDPKPILDGWKLLESTAIYRASGKNALYGEGGGFSIGQILLLPKPLLEKRVLSDERITVHECGRTDIRTGRIDRRVLATLAYLSESGLRPDVTSLRCGRETTLTSSGNVSHHSSGNAVDIAGINGIPILGNQRGRGNITETAVRRLMRLQGTLAASQIISLLDLGGNTLAMGDHADHIHIGFTPLFGDNPTQGQQALAVLRPGQWSDLIGRLREIDNPIVPRKTSRFSLPAKRRPANLGE